MSPHRKLGLGVLLQAFTDATYDGNDEELQFERDDSDLWIRECGEDFRMWCAIAGMDAEFLSEKWRAGQFDGRMLRSSEAVAQKEAAE